MIDIFAAMSMDGRIARVTITGLDGKTAVASIDVTAEQLAQVIASMGQVRAAMADKVTKRLDPSAPVFTNVTPNPEMVLGKQHAVSRDFYVALRHEGFGWLAFTFREDAGAAMCMRIADIVASMQPKKIITPQKGIVT